MKKHKNGLPPNKVLVSVHEECEIPSWFAGVEPFVLTALDTLEISGWELSVMFCEDAFMTELNSQYRGIDSPTDVLSFEQGDSYTDDTGEERFAAGDIVISIDTLFRNASEFSVPVDEELKRLLVHGVLHLDGYDHSDNSPEQEMLQLQEQILSKLLDKTDTIIKA